MPSASSNPSIATAPLRVGQHVAIRLPFGDGVTPRVIEDAMPINLEGELAFGAEPIAYWQYLVGDAYYVARFLEVL